MRCSLIWAWLLISLSVILTSCRVGESYSAGDADPVSQDPALDKIFADFVANPGNSFHLGLIAQIVTPTFRWSFAGGQSSLVPAASATPTLKFRIASISKTFTSVAICLLAQDGKLSLDDTVAKWVPAELAGKIPNAARMTIRHLLQHRSGLDDYDEEGVMIPKVMSQPDVPVPPEFSLLEAMKTSPKADPGSEYRYSNPGYILLSLIIDQASGIGYERFLATRIFEPLGLSDTSIPKERTISGPHMRCLADMDLDGTLEDYTDYYLDWDRGAGDLISTCADLNTFHQALLTGRLLNGPMMNEFLGFLENANTDLSVNGYSLGYSQTFYKTVGSHVQGHTGGYPGSASFMYFIPEGNAYVSLNMNIWGVSQGAFIREVTAYLVNKAAHAGAAESVP